MSFESAADGLDSGGISGITARWADGIFTGDFVFSGVLGLVEAPRQLFVLGPGVAIGAVSLGRYRFCLGDALGFPGGWGGVGGPFPFSRPIIYIIETARPKP